MITIAANIADTAILGIKAAFPDSVIGLVSAENDVLFLKNAIDVNSNLLKQKAETSSQANLNLAKLKGMLINTPQKKEQQKIGAFFKTLDDTIALHQQKLTLLQQVNQALLGLLFPKKGLLAPPLRFANYTEHWEQHKLGEMVKEFSVKSNIEDEHTVLSSTNSGMEIRDGRVSGTSNLGYKIIDDGDLVLSPQNLWLGNININNIGIGLVSPSYKTFKFTNIDSSFLKPQLRTSKMLEEYKNSSTQGASVVRRNLELDSFYQILIRVPNVMEQSRIGSFFINLENLINLHQSKLKILSQTKTTLLREMFI